VQWWAAVACLVPALALAQPAAPLPATPPPAAPQPPTLEKIRARGSIVLAHREASVPFSYLDRDKRPIGYSLDLCLGVVDATLSPPTIDGEALPIYRRWFEQPIPPKGIMLGVPPSSLLGKQFRFPSDKVGDALGG
jgi:hypothetical protein